MAEILKGTPVAAAIIEDASRRADLLRARAVEPCLAILRTGEKPGDMSYERGAVKNCGKAGIKVQSIVLDEGCSQAELLDTIGRINRDKSIHGCLMLRPLPAALDEDSARQALSAEKDVDCTSLVALGKVFTGRGQGFAPCTAQACVEILDHYGIDPAGKTVAVIGRSLVAGKPISMLLQSRDATVIMCHSRTVGLAGLCRQADILISAAGRRGLVDQRFTHPGQVILDVGINPAPGGDICGDVLDEAAELSAAYSPVPGGVGAVTSAVLCKHVIEAAERQNP